MRTIRTACACLALLVALGCDRESPKAIAVIPKGTTHEFWKSVHAGAAKAGQEFGVEIIWKGPLVESDRNSQIETVENFVSRGVAGIVLAPLDDTALVAPVTSATRAGIPVVIIDSGLKGEDYVSFVATDNRKGGEMAGERLAGLLGGKGKVAMLRYAVGSASTEQREAGFLDAMKKHPGIEVVSENQYAGATRETAFQASENLLNTLRGGSAESGLTVDGIFCPNESSTFGMLRALRDGGGAGKVRFVGFDAATDLVAALQAGEIDALVVQDPFNMGYLGVKTVVQKIRGEPVEKRIDTGATLVTKENIGDPKVAELLNPDLKKWLNE